MMAVNDAENALDSSSTEPGPSTLGPGRYAGLSDFAEETEVKMKPLCKREKKKTVLFCIGWLSEVPQGIHTESEETEFHSDETCDELDYMSSDEFDSPLYDDLCYSNWKKGCSFRRSTAWNRRPKHRPHRRVQKMQSKESTFMNRLTQKDNIESRLREKGLKRTGLDMYFRRVDSGVQKSGKVFTTSYEHQKVKLVGRTVAPTARRPRKQLQDHPAALKHELRSDNIPDGVGGFMRTVIDLQHRDLTPEDYELLLMLDESVAPKTVPKEALGSICVVTVDVAAVVGELCSICMELYQAAQNVKTLPCKHTFHADCIDHWLLTASQNCPLDGLAIVQA